MHMYRIVFPFDFHPLTIHKRFKKDEVTDSKKFASVFVPLKTKQMDLRVTNTTQATPVATLGGHSTGGGEIYAKL